MAIKSNIYAFHVVSAGLSEDKECEAMYVIFKAIDVIGNLALQLWPSSEGSCHDPSFLGQVLGSAKQ